MHNYSQQELEAKTKEELIAILQNLKHGITQEQVHEFGSLEKLQEHPSLHAHIQKVYDHSKSVSVMMFRILNLKQSAEIFSRNFPRKVITEVTKIVKHQMRETDILIKYSEENFIIIAPNTDIEGIQRYSIKLNKLIKTAMIGAVSHLDSNYALAVFDPSEGLGSLIVRLYEALLQAERDGSTHFKILEKL